MTQDIIAYAIFCTIITLVLIDNIRIRSARRKTSELYAQAVLDKVAVLKMLESNLEEKESHEIEKTDGFLKFVSDSRDWAFQYIEEVQSGLLAFKKKVDLDIKYITKYGQLIEHPLQDSINRIAEAYEELEKLLPTEQDQV